MQKIQLRSGFLVLDVSSASGGIHYERREREEKREGNREEVDFRTHREIDDIELYREGTALAGRARWMLRRRGAVTAIGVVTDGAGLAALETDFAELRVAADSFNYRARQAGSLRRVRVGYVPMQIEPDHEAIAAEIALTIRARLSDLLIALGVDRETGDPVRSRVALQACRRLDRLVVGIQSEAVRLALDAAIVARRAIRDAAKDGRTAMLDVSAIEAAANYFVPVEAEAEVA